MIIGVPRERKILEKRVGITPLGVRELAASGHTVIIEKAAGEGSGFSDQDYLSAGAKLADSLEEVWTEAELLVKVKEPHQDEYKYCRPGLILFDYLHLAGLPEVAKVLVDSGTTGLAYEAVQLSDGRLPLLEPMSVIAGQLSVINGANYLLSQNGGRGILLPSVNPDNAAKVVVLGYGVAGRAAAMLADSMGAQVSVVEKKAEKREQAKSQLSNNARIYDFGRSELKDLCSQADLLIGAVLIPGAAAPQVLDKDIISSMPKGSVFVDISIDQGGCSETSKTTSLLEPVFVESGVIHYCVPNMPAQAPRTATMALTSVTLPYIKLIADYGLEGSFEKSEELHKSLNVANYKLQGAAAIF